MNGSFYDFMIGSAERRIVAPLRRKLLTNLYGDIVEVGAGTGANFPFYPTGARVLALEPDASMARRARARIASSAAQIDLQIADDRHLDTLVAKSLDAVVVTLVLCSVEDPAASLRRARRVLKPAGTLVLLEHVRSSGNVGGVQDVLTPIWEQLLGGCHLNRDTDAIAASVGFDTRAVWTKTLPRFSPIQKLIYGSLYLRPAPLQ